jgi:hypothetical protein
MGRQGLPKGPRTKGSCRLQAKNVEPQVKSMMPGEAAGLTCRAGMFAQAEAPGRRMECLTIPESRAPPKVTR